MTHIQWRTSPYYGGDIAWFYGVLYRIKPVTRHKFEVAHGGQFYKQWQTFDTALSRLEAEAMCTAHAEATYELDASEA